MLWYLSEKNVRHPVHQFWVLGSVIATKACAYVHHTIYQIKKWAKNNEER
jgi:hypothetical protein